MARGAGLDSWFAETNEFFKEARIHYKRCLMINCLVKPKWFWFRSMDRDELKRLYTLIGKTVDVSDDTIHRWTEGIVDIPWIQLVTFFENTGKDASGLTLLDEKASTRLQSGVFFHLFMHINGTSLDHTTLTIKQPTTVRTASSDHTHPMVEVVKR